MGGTIPPPTPVRDEWSIAIYRGLSPFCLKQTSLLHKPVLSKNDVADVPAEYVADPFMIRVKGTWYMFFEVLNLQSKKGEIALATSADARRWAYQQVVLKEPFHLSYPYVFEWHNELFMVPETFETNTIRLYKGDPFPLRWSYVKTLISGKDYVDPSLVQYRDRWWLFASSGLHTFRAENLHLFSANNLIGPWQEHPCSPVIRGNMKIARPGGRVIIYQNRLIRFTQDCSETYGRQVHAFEVTELTPDRYVERMVCEEPILKPAKHGWNEMGMHHIDAHQLPDGSWLACVDGWRWVKAKS